jgi:hypothetical protein
MALTTQFWHAPALNPDDSPERKPLLAAEITTPQHAQTNKRENFRSEALKPALSLLIFQTG